MARKARKFQAQGRLALPVLEFAYLFLAIAHAPRVIIASKMLPEVDTLLAKLTKYEKNPKEYENGQGYHDDLCLARFLEGVCCRYIAYPASVPFLSILRPSIYIFQQDPDAILDENDNCHISKGTAISRAKAAFEAVFANGRKIELDHHLVYHSRRLTSDIYSDFDCSLNRPDYELGRLMSREGDNVGAQKQFDLVLSGKALEVNKKGKYSMEVSALMYSLQCCDNPLL